MGNSAPAPARTVSQKDVDLKFLAERLPFGDRELVHLYTVYHAILELEPHSSFLVDLGVHCCSTTTSTAGDSQDDERETLIRVMETKILLEDWGRRLYARTFCVDENDDTFGYNNNNSPRTATDEWTRKRRLEAFFEGIANCGRRGAKQSLTVLFDSCKETGSDQFCKPIDIVSTAYTLALATSFIKAASDDTLDMADYVPADTDDTRQLQALANSMLQRAHDKRANQRFMAFDNNPETLQQQLPSDKITLEELSEWCDTTGPLFASILPTFMHQLFFPGRPYPPSRTAYDFPYCLQESGFFDSPRSPLLFTFGCFSSALEGAYFRLYTSDHDGLSFNRLLNALLGYNGPTLIIIRSTTGGIFGAFTASQWKEGKDFYGQTDCFLYQMSPKTSVYRPAENTQRHFMYCNPEARSKGYDKQAHGLGFGGTVDRPRLFLAENFDDNVALSADLTFENGPLLPPRPEDGVVPQTGQFLIDSLEVWGVGGDEIVQQALSARDKARAVKDEGIRRARKVDKAQFLDDFRSGVIASKAFAYKDQIDGRAEQDVKERHAAQDKRFG